MFLFSFSAKSVSQHLLTVIAITPPASLSVPQSKAQPVITIADGRLVTGYGSSFLWNGAYVVVGNNGYIVRSTDGVHWSIKQSRQVSNVSHNSVTYGTIICCSYCDGKIVILRMVLPGRSVHQVPPMLLVEVLYGGGKFIAAEVQVQFCLPIDGITWTSITTGGAATDQFINILYTGSQYVIGSRWCYRRIISGILFHYRRHQYPDKGHGFFLWY